MSYQRKSDCVNDSQWVIVFVWHGKLRDRGEVGGQVPVGHQLSLCPGSSVGPLPLLLGVGGGALHAEVQLLRLGCTPATPDTSFMYMIAGLCMLKLYQKRHPDINASAYSAYACLAIVIFFSVLGVVRPCPMLWVP